MEADAVAICTEFANSEPSPHTCTLGIVSMCHAVLAEGQIQSTLCICPVIPGCPRPSSGSKPAAPRRPTPGPFSVGSEVIGSAPEQLSVGTTWNILTYRPHRRGTWILSALKVGDRHTGQCGRCWTKATVPRSQQTW